MNGGNDLHRFQVNRLLRVVPFSNSRIFTRVNAEPSDGGILDILLFSSSTCFQDFSIVAVGSGNHPGFTLHTLHCTLHTPHLTHCTLHTPHFTLHTPHSKHYTPHSTLHTPQHSTLHHTLHSTLYTHHTPHSTLHTPHSSLHALHSTLHTPQHSTLHHTLDLSREGSRLDG